MDKGLDTGNIIFQNVITIDDHETYRSLYDKLSELSYKMLRKHINDFFDPSLVSKKQNDRLATSAPTITSDDEKIN
jgi:methionyl-tRNA formyltransferase